MSDYNPWRGLAGRDITKADPGVITLRGDANAARDKAGKDALREPASEFEFEVPSDLQACFDRLEEIREDCGELYNQLYAVQMMGASATTNYKGTPSHIKLAIQQDLDQYEEEEMMVQARIMELQYAVPAYDHPEADHEDVGEEQMAKNDNTQPGKYVPGPAKDTAKRKLWPDQNRG